MNGNFLLGAGIAEIFRLAASGDLLSQRMLVEGCMQTRVQADENGGAGDLAAFEAVFWSRLAAAHGDETDTMRLSAALFLAAQKLGEAGRGDRAQCLIAEGVALVRTLAAQGYEPAERAANDVMGEIAPSVIQQSSLLMRNANG